MEMTIRTMMIRCKQKADCTGLTAGHPHIAPIIFLRLRDEFFNVTVGFCSLAGVLV